MGCIIAAECEDCFSQDAYRVWQRVSVSYVLDACAFRLFVGLRRDVGYIYSQDICPRVQYGFQRRVGESWYV